MASSQIKYSGPVAPGAPVKMVIGLMTFDSSYPTGGETLDLSAELDDVYFVHFESLGSTAGTGAAALNYDRVNKKVQVYGGAAANTELTEMTAAHNLAAFTKVGF